MRGVRTIIEAMGSPFVFDPEGPLRALVRERPDDWVSGREEERRERGRQHRPDVCRQSLAALEAIVPASEAMWGRTRGEPLEAAQETSVYGWLYRLGDEYIRYLQGKEQIALVVFAHFALLLKELEVFWFMEGWAEHIITGVDQFLDKEHRRWLEWPKEQVGLIEVAIKKYAESVALA